MTDRAFIDTNVAVYAYDDAEPARQEVAQRVLRARATRVVSTQVLAEFCVTVSRKLAHPLTGPEAAEATARLARFPVVSHDRQLVLAAVELSGRHQLSLWDALIVQAAVVGGCDRVLTEDLTDGQTIAGVKIENPFSDTSG